MATKLGFSILLIVFAIGVFLQIKIIKALKQDRTTAWEIQLSHSIVMLLHFSFVIIFEIAIYSIQSLDTYLRNWVCSATFFLRIVGTTEIICHSLMISFYKYIFIVHHNVAVKIGIDRMKKIICFVYLLFIVFNSLGYIFRPNTSAYNSVHNCGVQQADTKVDLPRQLFMCGITDYQYDGGYDDLVNIVTGAFCSIQTTLFILIYLNILEIFLYIGIFRHMKGWVKFILWSLEDLILV